MSEEMSEIFGDPESRKETVSIPNVTESTIEYVDDCISICVFKDQYGSMLVTAIVDGSEITLNADKIAIAVIQIREEQE